MLALTRKSITDLFLAISNIGGVRIYLRECFLPVIRCQCFLRIFLRIGVARLKVVTNGKIFFDGLGLSCKATVRDSKRTSVRIVSTRSRRQPRSVRRVKNSFFFDSNYSLTEFVVNKRKASVTAKYFLVFRISQVFPIEPFVVSFALLSYSICGFCRGYTCVRMIYKQRNLSSFVLVSIVERAQETFSVLVNVSSC